MMWNPFNSVIDTKTIINSMVKEKSRIKKPILSVDEITNIEEMIMNAYYNKISIIITYFNNGYVYQNKGILKKIDTVNKLIYLNDSVVFFSSILSIKEA